ncbi:MAG: FAD-dependent oxidoreductase, partial [Candidatus Acidiferrales bacterium]
MNSFDLIVIGSGPAGEKAAAQAAYFGKRVALVEAAEDPGGACVNTGTLPSKILRESALYFSGIKQRGLYGVDYSLREGLTVKDFSHRKNVIVEHERYKVQKNLALHHVEVFAGLGSFVDAHTISVKAPQDHPVILQGEVILIATGSHPYRPSDVPFDDRYIFDSDS